MNECVGISKLRLMAGGSAACPVCNTPIKRPRRANFPANHLCPEHLDVKMVVVDSESYPSARRIGETWHEPGRESDGTR